MSSANARDTRALTKKIRERGAMNGVLTDRADLSDDELVARAQSAPNMNGQNLVPLVGCSKRASWTEPLGEWKTHQPRTSTLSQPKPKHARFRVLALDCGIKANILRNLTERGCDVVLAPHDTPASEILRLHRAKEIDGVFISNGPGDPAAVTYAIETIKGLLGKVPVFGICLGHQLIALAAGAKTFKLKFGHRGGNQPVLEHETGKVEITSQNHGFAVDVPSLAKSGFRATHTNLNDQTNEGIASDALRAFAVQYHPEAAPGPHDAMHLFGRFRRLVETGKISPEPAPVAAAVAR